MENREKYVAQIRDRYIPQEHTKLDELRELDNKVKLPALIFAYLFGTFAALVFGTGMCLAMGVIGASVMSATVLMVVGVIVGCVGLALCTANYFIYSALLRARKKKYGDQIVALSNELLNE